MYSEITHISQKIASEWSALCDKIHHLRREARVQSKHISPTALLDPGVIEDSTYLLHGLVMWRAQV